MITQAILGRDWSEETLPEFVACLAEFQNLLLLLLLLQLSRDLLVCVANSTLIREAKYLCLNGVQPFALHPLHPKAVTF